jgi:hypothetical protein
MAIDTYRSLSIIWFTSRFASIVVLYCSDTSLRTFRFSSILSAISASRFCCRFLESFSGFLSLLIHAIAACFFPLDQSVAQGLGNEAAILTIVHKCQTYDIVR